MNTFYLQKEAEVGDMESPNFTQLLTISIAKIAVKNVDRQEKTHTIQKRDNLENLCYIHYPTGRIQAIPTRLE